MKQGSIVLYYGKLCKYMGHAEFEGAEIIYVEDNYHRIAGIGDLTYVCDGRFNNKCDNCKHRFICLTL